MRTAMDVSNEASSEVQPSDVASFAVGDTFSSYDDLKKKLAEFESRQKEDPFLHHKVRAGGRRELREGAGG